MADQPDERKGKNEEWGERPEHRKQEQHVPYAQQQDKGDKKDRPGKDEHAAGGQGLSG